jgi:hypothetical protein
MADVSPSRADGPLTVVVGDGRVDIADVVLALRASGGLAQLAWPERTLVVRLAGGPGAVGLSLVARDGPTWAEATSLDSGARPPDALALDGALIRSGSSPASGSRRSHGLVEDLPEIMRPPARRLRWLESRLVSPASRARCA